MGTCGRPSLYPENRPESGRGASYASGRPPPTCPRSNGGRNCRTTGSSSRCGGSGRQISRLLQLEAAAHQAVNRSPHRLRGDPVDRIPCIAACEVPCPLEARAFPSYARIWGNYAFPEAVMWSIFVAGEADFKPNERPSELKRGWGVSGFTVRPWEPATDVTYRRLRSHWCAHRHRLPYSFRQRHNAMFDSLASNIRFCALTIGSVTVELSHCSGIYCAQSGVSQWAKCTMLRRSSAA